MTHFAILYSYDPNSPLIAEIRPAHREFLGKLKEDGILVGSGPFTDGDGGALIVIRLSDTATLADAQALMDQDPFFTGGALGEGNDNRQFNTWNPVLNVFQD
ncbi:YciI family protein [Corynebacterium sp. HS2168-gen11]|uniref:YciI family protein n=1 Tax=Corynebacterium sp. HS2168-gen11 TaxID=2974027 RepID=UPI00216B16A2|nr:YciI family protein [Corynebacterium sp. HS2168-gen11]MCS4536338.1 YciI family protein [Corynebacterium sp. HS2168-gen11]